MGGEIKQNKTKQKKKKEKKKFPIKIRIIKKIPRTHTRFGLRLSRRIFAEIVFCCSRRWKKITRKKKKKGREKKKKTKGKEKRRCLPMCLAS